MQRRATSLSQRPLSRLPLIAAISDGQLIVADVSKKKVLATFGVQLPVNDFALSPDGSVVVLASNAYVTILNVPKNTSSLYAVPANLQSTVVFPDYAYFFPPSPDGQWSDIFCVNLQNGTIGKSLYNAYVVTGDIPAQHPSLKYMYAVDERVIPQSLHKFQVVGGSTCVQLLGNSPGMYSYGASPLSITADGTRILCSTGYTFSSSATPGQDMVYAGTLGLSNNPPSITSVAQQPAGKKDVLALDASYPSGINVYSWPVLKRKSQIDLSSLIGFTPMQLWFGAEGKDVYVAGIQQGGLVVVNIPYPPSE